MKKCWSYEYMSAGVFVCYHYGVVHVMLQQMFLCTRDHPSKPVYLRSQNQQTANITLHWNAPYDLSHSHTKLYKRNGIFTPTFYQCS